MALDSPRVAFDNQIKQAVLLNGVKKNDINTIFNDDNSNGFILRTDQTGSATIELKSRSSINDSFIFGSHRYDISGQTIDFNFDLQFHDGVSFTSLKTGSFINKKESMYNSLPAHTLGLPTSTKIITGLPDVLKRTVWSGNRFVGIGVNANVLYTSIDGVTWVKDLTVPAGTYNDVKAIDDKIVLCGNAGFFAYFDGSVWTSPSMPTVSNMNAVSTNLSMFAVVGDNNEIWTTTDLINFTQVTSPAPVGTSFDGIDNINFAFIFRSSGGVWSTTDSFATLTPFNTGGGSGFTNIKDSAVFGGEYYVCGPNDLVAKSVDFINFTLISSTHVILQPKTNLGISVTESEIVVVNDFNEILVSNNGGNSYTTLPYNNQNGLVTDLSTNGIDYIISNSVDTESFFIDFKYKLIISGLSQLSDFLIPELFIGSSITIGHVSYGVDPKSIRSGIKKFNSENGRVFESVLYNRLELSFSLDVVDFTIADNIDLFRQYIYNTRSPIWFMFLPDTDPYASYLMKVDGQIDLIIQSPVHKSSKVKFVEFI